MKTPSIYLTTSPGLRNTMKLSEEKKNEINDNSTKFRNTYLDF